MERGPSADELVSVTLGQPRELELVLLDLARYCLESLHHPGNGIDEAQPAIGRRDGDLVNAGARGRVLYAIRPTMGAGASTEVTVSGEAPGGLTDAATRALNIVAAGTVAFALWGIQYVYETIHTYG